MGANTVSEFGDTRDYTQHIKEAAESICGALHRFSFEFIGESLDGASTFFHRGQHPKDMRIEVLRSGLAPMVLVNLEWRNLALGGAYGRMTCQVDVRGNPGDVFAATEQAVLRCLLVFRDVLEGKGVAGPGAKRAEINANDMPATEGEENDAGLNEE